MKQSSKGVQIVVWSILALVIGVIVFLYAREQSRKSDLPVYGQIQPFALTNQLGEEFTLKDLKGRVWVADIIFTRCAGPCPKMTQEMAGLQNAFSEEPKLEFVTLTTDPDHDSPKVLKRYAGKFGADSARWNFLTGTKPEIKNLAIGSLKLAAIEKEEEQQQNENDLFIHSTTFILVDKHGRMRGAYESLEPGFQEKISSDIRELLRET